MNQVTDLQNVSLNMTITGRRDAILPTSLTEQVLAGTAYTAIALVGLLGNILTILVMVLDKSMRTTTNWIITCLASTDLLMCLSHLVFLIPPLILDRWPYSHTMCVVRSFLLLVTAAGTMITLLVIAFLRYLMVVQPEWLSRQPMSIKKISMTTLITGWSLCLICSSPVFFLPQGAGYVYYAWACIPLNTTINAINATLFYTLPAIAVPIFSVKIFKALKTSASSVATYSNSNNLLITVKNDKNPSQQIQQKIIKRSRHVFYLLVTMYSTFICLYTPLTLTVISEELGASISRSAYLFVKTIFMTTSAINPFLYAATSLKFRHSYKQILTCTTRADRDTGMAGSN